MSSHANPVQTRAERPVLYELTVVWAAAEGSDSPRRKTFTLDRSLRIGADSANHIVVDGEGVGAFHARFFPGPTAPTIVLSDSVASINGLEVSGSAGLIPGDVLSVGDCEVRVSVRGARPDSSAGTAARWQLISDEGAASVQVASDVIIGNDAGCGIRLPDDDISARHVQLVPREGALWVRDFSDGATFVNDDPVRGACRLEPDDMLRLGQHRFRAARQTVVTVEPATATPVATEPTPANSFSLRSHVTTAIDLPTIEDAQREVFPPVKPAPVKPITEKVPPMEALEVKAPPVKVPAVEALEVKAPPVKPPEVKPAPEKPILEKSSPEKSPLVKPPPVESPQVKLPLEPLPEVKASSAKPRLEKPPPEKSPAVKPSPAKPLAAARDAIWELDSLEMPAIDPHFELLDSEEPMVAPVVPEAVPPRAPPRTGPKAVAATERPVVSIRVVPVSTQQLSRRRNERTTGRTTRRTAGRTTSRTAGRTTRWWVLGLLLLILTLVWAVAMRPPASDDGSALTDALDRSVAAARTLQTSIVDRWRMMLANRARTASESASTASVPATDGVPAPNSDAIETDGVAQPTPEIIELQRNAAAGDAAAIARLKELGDFYAALASSAMERGDREAAQRHLAMVVLMRPITPKVAESAPAAPPPTPEPASRQRQVSRADALAQEARQLQSRGAVVSPARRNAVGVLVEALTLDPSHEGARRQLNQAIGSLNGRIDTLIANHQFRAAGSLLAQLADNGIPVLSNGNVRDRPEFLEARSWQPLAVSSLLVEADALIQQGLIATPGDDNAISRLESATRIDPGNPLIEDMRAKISGMLFLAAKNASERGMREEARRLTNLANYARDGFGA